MGEIHVQDVIVVEASSKIICILFINIQDHNVFSTISSCDFLLFHFLAHLFRVTVFSGPFAQSADFALEMSQGLQKFRRKPLSSIIPDNHLQFGVAGMSPLVVDSLHKLRIDRHFGSEFRSFVARVAGNVPDWSVIQKVAPRV